MRQQVRIAGATYNDVPRISVPDANNVYHSFIDEGELNKYYEGNTTPSSLLGNDGDIYLDTTGGGGGTPNLQAKTNISPTTSSQTITADEGYDGLSSVQINAMPSGSATAPASISGTSATVSTGTNTLTLSKTVSVTPTVSAGYVSSGTAGNSSVSLTASVTTQAAQTIHPSTSDQSIASATYLTGRQTIKGVTMTNLTAGNIKSGVVVKIGDSTDDDCVTSVTGTYDGGGGSANIQALNVTANGTYTASGGVDGYSPITVSVSATGKKQVNFIDYDGTIVHSYTRVEANALASLPSNPSHTGLTAEGWNWTLAQIKSYLTSYPTAEVWVGQMYTTTSGKTEVDFTLNSSNQLSPYLVMCVNGTMVVDWGDGSATTTVTGTSMTTYKYTQHTYSSPGSYTITIEATSGAFCFKSSSSSNVSILTPTNAQGTAGNYSSCVKRVRLGASHNTIMAAYEFTRLYEVEYITIPKKVVTTDSSFYHLKRLKSLTIPGDVTDIFGSMTSGCESMETISLPNFSGASTYSTYNTATQLKSVTLPHGITAVGQNAFNGARGLEKITIPSTVTSIGSSAFKDCTTLAELSLPSGCTSIGNYAFQNCYALHEITMNGVTDIGVSAFSGATALNKLTIPSVCTNIGNSAFSNCSSLGEVHVLATTPPTRGTTIFSGINTSILKIYVPSASVDTYKAADGWSTYSSYIYGE